MAIDIYDKASIVKKNELYYYFIKNGSKNCFTCPFQSIVDNNFNNHYIRGQSRESNWHIVAIGNQENVKNDTIADIEINAPTSVMYGEIRFGNKKNIALYFAKNKNKIMDYNLLNEMQQHNIDELIKQYVDEYKMQYTIKLWDISDDKKMKLQENYCGNLIYLENNFLEYAGKRYWNLDNL